MKFFKDLANRIYAYEEDGSQDHIIPKEYIAITKEEAKAIYDPPPSPEQQAASAKMKQYVQDVLVAKEDPKLKELVQMSPPEVQKWMAENVKDLTQVQDVLSTLAIAVSVLAKRF
jgi:hypothetical protein